MNVSTDRIKLRIVRKDAYYMNYAFMDEPSSEVL